MSKEQIEEMAKVICLSYGKGVCRQCDDYDFCTVRQEAERLYAAGYRKQSEVAREIFEEIERIGGVNNGLFLYNFEIAKLKKKYTEGREWTETNI